MKKTLVLSSVALLACGLMSSCGDSTAEPVACSAYGVVNGGACVAEVKLTVADKLIKTISINETYTPVTWTELSATEAETVENISVEVTSWSGTKTINYAKYVKVDGVVYTGEKLDAAADGQYVKYMAGTVSLMEKIKDNSEWYWNCVVDAANKITVASNAEGTAVSDHVYFAQKAFKADENSTYWPQTATALGWKGNIAAIEAYLVGKDPSKIASFVKATEAGEDEKKYFMDGTVSTGATINATDAYLQLAKAAFAKVK